MNKKYNNHSRVDIFLWNNDFLLISALNIFIGPKRYLFISLIFRLYSKCLYMREFISTVNFHCVEANSQMVVEGQQQRWIWIAWKFICLWSSYSPSGLSGKYLVPLRKAPCQGAQGADSNGEGSGPHPTGENMIGAWLWKRPVDFSIFHPECNLAGEGHPSCTLVSPFLWT